VRLYQDGDAENSILINKLEPKPANELRVLVPAARTYITPNVPVVSFRWVPG